MEQDDVEEAFIIYREDKALHLQWANVPPLNRQPAVRLCALEEPHLLFLLTTDECLYLANISKTNVNSLCLELQRSDVVDMAYCRQLRKFFVVTARGEVHVQEITSGGKINQIYRTGTWQTLSFDPLELSEEGIFIQRVCCSAQGVFFIARTGEIYVMGSCGEVFNAEVQPKHLKLFEEFKVVLDVVAGEEFFSLLLQCNYPEENDPLDLLSKQQNIASTSLYPSPGRNNIGNNLEIESSNEDVDKKPELSSNSSVRSYSSTKSNNTHQDDFESTLNKIIKRGYGLLHTQVCTFGAENGGLLGTGDHIKRNTINFLQKLDSQGICSITAGREHSVARTIDGRLFHWGLNSQLQLSNNKLLSDLSSPTELKLDSIELDTSQQNVLSACCGDYKTVLLNARGEVRLNGKETSNAEKDLINLHMRVAGIRKTIPLLLASREYTLHNRRLFQRQFHTFYTNLQQQLRLLLKYRHGILMLELFQQKSTALVLKQMHVICVCYHKILYLIVGSVRSFEDFYRADFMNAAELLFVQHYRECIELFSHYTKVFCDIYCVDGFGDATKLFNQLSSMPLLPEQQDSEVDLLRIFQQPWQAFPIYIQFLEKLIKSRREYTEHLLAWEAFARQQRIDFELAENTLEFWKRNERNTKIRQFRRKQRRVLLSSTTVPLKLANNSMIMSSTTFILFSDCLCQVGGHLYTFPLVVLWLKMENDTSLRITTPERSFTLMARSHHGKKVWYDQIESAIKLALGRVPEANLSNVRVTSYMFSRNHSKYPGVHAYGRWRNGVLHGNCYLEYPDGKVYFGQIRNGEIEGFGKMVIPSVGFYEGTFKAGKFHGHGIYEMKDNEVYEGNFRDGLFHGHGMFRSNHYTYVGEYQANAKSGYGILDDMLSGDKYMGMFADNKRVGAGICITMNGDYFEGMFSNGDLEGTGIGVLENDYYYEGELCRYGPIGKGTYYMPSGTVNCEDSGISDEDAYSSRLVNGNVLSGQLSGNWQDVRIVSGTIGINRQFLKYPRAIGALVVDNSRKWRSLFDNFEEEVLGSALNNVNKNMENSTKIVWNRIAVFMNTQRERERSLEKQDTFCHSTRSYFAKNISMGFSSSFDKLSLKSTNSLLNTAKSSILDLSGNLTDSRRSHSQETLNDADVNDFDVWNPPIFTHHIEDNSINGLLNIPLSNWAHDSNSPSLRSSFDSVLNLHETFNNNSFTSQSDLEIVPSFGVNTLTEQDMTAIKEYLLQAFKDHHHPLFLLNQRIANCFYTSYGCWKVKPTPILAKQAMHEWESISKRVYKFVRKMFPALPEDYCIIESSREVVSHITLLYPIVLSEGIYSTLFVLYANKHSVKDEMYRQNLIYADKLKDEELAECLTLDSSLLAIVKQNSFTDAIQTLKQLKEKYSPKAMLTVIEDCMQQITEAHKIIASSNSVILSADSMMPLTLFLVLRAGVPHLGAELALLDDLTGGTNFQFDMNGMAGYCYTTLKAAYEHITAVPLNKT